MSDRRLVFFSYRHDADGQRWLQALQGVLEPYVLAQDLVAWSDRDIRVGSRWHSQIVGAIERTRVAVLLVNQTFFASRYICEQELPRLVAEADAGRLILVVVPIGHCDPELLARHRLSETQCALDYKKPLNARSGNQRERALVETAVKIHKIHDASGPIADEARLVEPEVGLLRGESIGIRAGLDNALGPLIDVPPLNAARHVARDAELAELRAQLLGGDELAIGLTSSAPGLGLHGMGGMGKSVMAQALCHDDAVRRAFPDGIAWVALGQKPELLTLQNALLRGLDPAVPPGDSIAEARSRLEAALAGKRVLLVVDDIWDADHFRPFNVARGHSRLLLTTRDATVLAQVGARATPIRRMPDAIARKLLASRSGCAAAALPPEADEVLRLADGHPLAIALAGAQIADGVSWETLAGELRQGRIDFLDHRYGSVFASLGRSVDSLPDDERERYLELAVFPEDVVVPTAVVARMWALSGGLSAARSEQLLARFERKALLTLAGSARDGTMALHDLQQDFVRLRTPDMARLHGLLLDSHRVAFALPSGAGGWSKLPREEQYLGRFLTAHLAAAGRIEELRTTLLDFDWIAARLAAETRLTDGAAVSDTHAVVQGYSALPDDSVIGDMARALQMSAHVLRRHPEALAQQVHGRLGESANAELRTLAERALAAVRQRERWSPTVAAHSPPGAQVQVMEHGNAVNGALLLPDGRRALSWSADRTLRLWDLECGGDAQVLAGHVGLVNGALLLPDGRRALSWSSDHTLRLWDLDRGGDTQVLVGHDDSVFGALLLPDGRRVLTLSADHALRLWDLERGVDAQVLVGHDGPVFGALMLRDGRRALSWSADRTLRLWDLESVGEAQVLAGHESWVHGAELLPDGRRVLSWSADQTLRLWDLERGGEAQVLAGHEGSIYGALVLLGGRRVLSWSKDRTLRLWDLERGGDARVLAGHEGSTYGALLLPDCRRVLSWSADCTLRVWDPERGGDVQVLAGHKGSVYGALLLPDGRRTLSWSKDSTLRLWDLERGGDARVLAGHEGSVDGALLLADGRRALSWSDDRTLRLWDLERGGDAQMLAGHKRSVYGALLLADGRRVLSWSKDRTLRLWELERGGDAQVLAGHEGSVRGALLLADDRRALSWSKDHTVRLWDLDRGSHAQVLLGHEGSVDGALLLADGRRALSWSSDHTLRLWDLESGGDAQVLAGHVGLVNGALLLADGRRALSWSDDRTLRLWDLERGGDAQVLAGHDGWVQGALLLADGRRVLSWSDDRTLRLWDLEGVGEALVLTGHESWVHGTELLPDGRRALSWSADQTLRLWDLERCGETQVLAGHEGSIYGALLLPGGRRALSWSKDRTLRLWDIARAEPVACYWADAAIGTVVVASRLQRIFVGDALGRIQILRMKPSAQD